MNHTLFNPIHTLKAILPFRKGPFESLVGERIIDLLWHLPTNIIHRIECAAPDKTLVGKMITTDVEVLYHEQAGRSYKIICEADGQKLDLVFFNGRASFLQRMAMEGARITVSGKLEVNNHRGERFQITHPDFMGSLAQKKFWIGVEPVYPLTARLTQTAVRMAVNEALKAINPGETLEEWIPAEIKDKRKWPSFSEALKLAHAPSNLFDLSNLTPARERLAFDELLAHQLTNQLGRYEQMRPSKPLNAKGNLAQTLKDLLPFSLTQGQEKAIGEIIKDMGNPTQMLRLLQGDVGSGKTLVALVALLHAVEAGVQGAFLAPTDILVQQHYAKMKPWMDQMGVNLVLLTAREKGKTKEAILENIKNGSAQIILGTHALIQDNVAFQNLGMVVVDEQHRFGVEQRLALTSKGFNPHILTMTATPIPRTLQLVSYGDMDVSVLREKPQGRLPIATKVVSLERLDEVISAIQRALEKGRKIYWVCPLIEESEKLKFTAVLDRFESLKRIFGEKVVLVHGKMKNAEKDIAMDAFQKGDAQILIATTVIEVGVDVPEATIMIIEHGERFGLSQLHQLRGRVGRGSGQSTCIVLYGKALTPTARRRLEAIRKTEDGFELAEADLRLRGAGEIYGTRQSGIPKFKIARFDPDNPEEEIIFNTLLSEAHTYARNLCKSDPHFTSPAGKAAQILLRLYEKEKALEYKKSG